MPGTRRADQPGDKLRCLVLSRGRGEWIGLDVASGALVRVDHEKGPFPPGFSIVELTLGPFSPIDPARREAVSTSGELVVLGKPRPRPLARLLDSLALPARRAGPLLTWRGPSVSYLDLDAELPSLVLVSLKGASFELATREHVVIALVALGPVVEVLPVLDERARRAALAMAPRPLRGDALKQSLGFKPAYILAGLDRIEDGHAKKVVFSIMANTGAPLG